MIPVLDVTRVLSRASNPVEQKWLLPGGVALTVATGWIVGKQEVDRIVVPGL